MNARTSLSTVLPDHSAFFASLLATDPDLAAYVTEAYAVKPEPGSDITVTRTANVKSVPLMGIRPGKGKADRKTGPGSRGGKVKEPSEKAEPRPLCILTLRTDGPGASHFLSALSVAGKRPRLHVVPGSDVVTGEVWSPGDPVLGQNGEPIFYFDANLQRPDEAAAIRACFSGYDYSEAHGYMLDMARSIAKTQLSREWAGTIWDRAFHYTGITFEPVTVVHTIEFQGVPVAAHPHRSPEQHEASWSVEGWIKGMPNYGRKVLADLGARGRVALEEVITLGKLRELAAEGAEARKHGQKDLAESIKVDFTNLLEDEYPPTKMAEPIYDVDGVTVKSYTVVLTDHSVVQALKREEGMSLVQKVTKLEAFAVLRLGEIQRSMDAMVERKDADRMVELLQGMSTRGSTLTLEESVMSCYDHGSRQYYTLPVNAVVDARSIERAREIKDERALFLTK